MVNNRNGFTYAANIVVLAVALLMFLTVKSDIDQFRYLCFTCIGLGFFSSFFYITMIWEVPLSKETQRPSKPAPLIYSECLKQYTYDQDKVCTPEETVAWFKQKLSEVDLEIMTDVQRVDTGRLDIPVYFSVCGRDAFEVIRNKKQMGKGATPAQSMASACMELA